jgi:hypothetical protein
MNQGGEDKHNSSQPPELNPIDSQESNEYTEKTLNYKIIGK